MYTIYYTSLFILSLGVMKNCFQMPGKEILFAGVCGYAAQHIGFSVATICVEITGIKFKFFSYFIFVRF